MADEVHPKTLGDYFTLQRGTTYKSRLLGQPGPLLLGLATIQRNGGFRSDSLRTYGGDSPKNLLVQPGDLYASLKDVTQSADLLGAVARLPAERALGRLTQDTVKLEPKSLDVPCNYIYWLLRTPQYRSYCRAHATGTTNLGLPRDDFLAFPVPELTKSRSHITSVLSTLDDKIELNRRMNETLEAVGRALFKSWFVDFDPVRAKMDGHGRPDVSLGGSAAKIFEVFPERLDEDSEGPLPTGWQRLPLGELLESSIGGDWGKETEDRLHNETVAVIRGTDLPSLRKGRYSSVPQRLVDPKKLEKRVLRPGDIVLETSGGSPTQPTGRSLYMTKSILDGFETRIIPASFCKRLRPRTVELSVLLAMHLEILYLRGGTWEYQNQSTGISNFQTKRFLENELVVVPDKKVLTEFWKQVAGLIERARSNESLILSRIRDTLLPRLFSGEILIRNRESEVGNAR